MEKMTTIIIATIFVLFGLLGFVSNPLVGSNALFATDTVYNLIHIIFGAILFTTAFWFKKNCMLWLKTIGVLMFILGLVGILTIPPTGGSLIGIAYANGTSNWLHLIAGIIIFAAGIYCKDEERTIAQS
jgi:hypothetical protein